MAAGRSAGSTILKRRIYTVYAGTACFPNTTNFTTARTAFIVNWQPPCYGYVIIVKSIDIRCAKKQVGLSYL